MPEIVRVTFRKQLSDGSYGTEAAEITLEAETDDDLEVDADELGEALLMQARRLVHAELARSPSANVRRAVGAAEATDARRAVPIGGEEHDRWR